MRHRSENAVLQSILRHAESTAIPPQKKKTDKGLSKPRFRCLNRGISASVRRGWRYSKSVLMYVTTREFFTALTAHKAPENGGRGRAFAIRLKNTYFPLLHFSVLTFLWENSVSTQFRCGLNSYFIP